MPITDQQAKVLALAIFEIRVLLGGYVGTKSNGDIAVHAAANLAYALHNQALAVLKGSTFDVDEAINGLGFVDRVCDADFKERFKSAIQPDV